MSQEIEADLADNGENQDQDEAMSLPELSVRYCPNCDNVLTGAFCTSCGQKDYNLLRPFWHLMEDTMGDLFSFDSRFFGTLFPLFFKPGFVTRAFNQGRRMRFVPPFRQYLVISVIFFLLLVSFEVNLFEENDVNINDKISEKLNKANSEIDPQTLPEENRDSAHKIIEDVVQDLNKNRKDNLSDATDSEKKLYGETVGFLGGLSKVIKNPVLLNKVIADWIPKTMFFMLPIFAFILKLFYIRRKKYYIEHLVFSLHFHAFIFLLFTLMLLLYHYIPLSHGYLSYLLWYIPVYMFLAQWKVYQQGPIKTFFKTLFISFTYFIVMNIGLSIAIGYGLSKI